MKGTWPRWVRWAWLLPVMELLLAGIVAGPLASEMLLHPPHLSRSFDGKIILNMKDPAIARWLQEGGPRFPSRFEDIYYLNVPATLVEIGISLPTSWPESYRPKWAWPIGLFGFRALTWPIWALPFWFFAGRGIDSFLGKGHISAAEAFFMGILGIAIALLGAGIALSGSSDIHPRYEAWIAVPAAMWLAFGVVCQMAWWLQRKAAKAQQASSALA